MKGSIKFELEASYQAYACCTCEAEFSIQEGHSQPCQDVIYCPFCGVYQRGWHHPSAAIPNSWMKRWIARNIRRVMRLLNRMLKSL